MRTAILALAVFLTLAGEAVCDTSGRSLLPRCEAALDNQSPNYADIGYCEGFIEGVLSASQVFHLVFNTPRLFCLPPDGVPLEQLARVVVKYLKDHPEVLDYRGSSLVLVSIKNAFVCERDDK